MEARRSRKFIPIACRIGAGFLCLAHAISTSAADTISHEYQIKAAFLFNFTRFIEWPVESFADPASPIVIGVIGNDPFGAELANVLKGRRVNGRPLLARSVARNEDARTTHLLFVGLSQPDALARLMQTLQGYPVTTVGESAAFADAGGIINFVLQGDKLRFEINAHSAEVARVRISAQLEKLATVVRGTTQSKEGACERCVTSRSSGS